MRQPPLDLLQVQHLMQDCLFVLIAANPKRTSPWADVDPETPWMKHLPSKKFVRTFLKRHRLVFRSSMPLNHGRAILKVEDLREWQDLTEAALFGDPDLAEMMEDGSRIFNQDETALCPGILSICPFVFHHLIIIILSRSEASEGSCS